MAQQEYKRLIESARRYQAFGEWAAFVGLCFLALILIYAAYQVYRKGLQISKGHVLTGTLARIIAVVLLLIGLGVIAFGLFYYPGLLR